MDKLSVISGALFVAADVFAIASLCMPYWIVSSVNGYTYLGLLQVCLTIYNREIECFTPNTIQPEWLFVFITIFLGILCITATIILLVISCWRYNAIKLARWSGFVAMVLLCMAAVIFPIGFRMEHLGSGPFYLPHNYQVGVSYIFFLLSLWITVVSELFAGKVCLPHF